MLTKVKVGGDKMISDWKKMFVPLFAAIFAVVLLQTVSAAAITVTNRTGTIRITRPDGAVLTVNAEDPLPEIPSGSKIELLTGAAEFALTEGSIEVIVAGSIATVEAGDSLWHQ